MRDRERERAFITDGFLFINIGIDVGKLLTNKKTTNTFYMWANAGIHILFIYLFPLLNFKVGFTSTFGQRKKRRI